MLNSIMQELQVH